MRGHEPATDTDTDDAMTPPDLGRSTSLDVDTSSEIDALPTIDGVSANGGVRHRGTIPSAAWSASLLIGLGCALLALYFAARLTLSIQHEADLRAFREGRHTEITSFPVAARPAAGDSADAPADVSAEPPALAIAPPDSTLWSEHRLRAHVAALELDAARPPMEGVLRIPTLGLEVAVYEGTSDQALDRGAGRIEGTPPLGPSGNVGIAGHRDGFFRSLKDIAVGDEIVVELTAATLSYEVVTIRVVKPEDVWVLAPTEEPTLTLVTCYPFYFVGAAPDRFVAQATISPRHPW